MKLQGHYLLLIVVIVLAVSCRRDSVERQRLEYEAVEEGVASGVSPALQGPGEVLPPLTGTNYDTTTAFTLDPAAAGAAPVPVPPSGGTIAGTLPPPDAATPSYPASAPSASPPPATGTPQPSTTREPARSAPSEPAPAPAERRPPPPAQPPPVPTPPTQEPAPAPEPPREERPAEPAPPPPEEEREPPPEPPPDEPSRTAGV
jgi:hypothetical protein